MPSVKYILILIAALSLYACKNKGAGLKEKQREIETGLLDSTNTYTAEEIGWTMTIHEGWDIQSKEDIRASTERGKKLMEETLNSQVDASGLKQLLNLHKGKLNSFESIIERYDSTELGNHREKTEWLYSVIKDAYTAKGIPAEYSEGAATIDGLSFNVFRMTIYTKNKSEVLVKQDMYSRLLNGYDLGITIKYRDDETQLELENMLFSSKFSKRQ